MLGGSALLTESRREDKARFDIPGVLLVTTGLVAIVYGTTQAESDGGWGSATVIGPLALGAALLVAFAVVERRVPQPLLPPRVMANRTRGAPTWAWGWPSWRCSGRSSS
ncbi:hypothetical protein GCM10009801_57320 [Streptomyces albiaxialis]|uniref:Uncharacterized protein n=1 Tax=Streptomyces albiaxialis TaxID=329523 RepID=A0ABN2WFQ9_9ACTN